MKKFTLFTFLFLIGFAFTHAQTITNPSFENWTSYPSGSYPTGWNTSDSASMSLSSTHSAVQELVEKCHLNYAVKMTTWSIGGFLTVPGAATNGIIKQSGATFIVYGGNPDVVRNDSLTGCYEYTPQGTNVATIAAYLFKRNGANRDTIAVALLNPTAAGSMTSFSIPFIYIDKDPSHLPDSILVALQSSALNATAPNVGSVLIVDNLGLKGILSSVTDPNAAKDIKVYPMPVNGDLLNIDATAGHFTRSTYSLIDGLGRIVLKGDLQEKQQINVASLANGIYTLTLNDASGEKLYTTRVTVRR